MKCNEAISESIMMAQVGCGDVGMRGAPNGILGRVRSCIISYSREMSAYCLEGSINQCIRVNEPWTQGLKRKQSHRLVSRVWPSLLWPKHPLFLAQRAPSQIFVLSSWTL